MRSASAIFVVSVSILCSLPARAQTWLWGKVAVPTGVRTCEGWNIAADGSGNVYESGVIYNAIYSGTPYYTVFGDDTAFCAASLGSQTILMSADSNGHSRWALGTTAQSAHPLGLVSDSFANVYLYGAYAHGHVSGPADPPFTFGNDTLNVYPGAGVYHYYLTKVDSTGRVLWMRDVAPLFTGSNGLSGSLSIDKRGNLYVSGQFNAPSITIGGHVLTKTGTSANSSDIFIARYDSSGAVVWAHNFGGDSSQHVFTGATAPGGDTYLSGYTYSHNMRFAYDTLHNPNPTVAPYIFIVKYDIYGNQQWARGSGGGAYPTLAGMATDKDGNAYLVGDYMGGLSFGAVTMVGNHNFMLKMAPNGNAVWGVTVPGTGAPVNWGIAIDNCNNVWVASGTHGLSWGFPDPLIISQYTNWGGYVTSTSVQSGGDDMAGLAVDNLGHLYVSGDVAYRMGAGPDTIDVGTYMGEWFFMLGMKYPYSFCSTPPLLPLETPEIPVAQSDVAIFPNPATNECTVIINIALAADARISLIDVTGREVATIPVHGSSTTFSVSSLRTGVYQCRIYTQNGTCILKRLAVLR